MVDGSDVTASEGQAVPPTQSTGGRSRILSRSLPPPLVGIRPPGTDGRA